MNQPRKTYRLVTQPNLDGLACAVLLKERGLIRVVDFTHPRDLQSGGGLDFNDDIVTGLPFVRGGQQLGENGQPVNLRLMKLPNNFVVDLVASSAARVVCRYLGGERVFPDFFKEMLTETDRAGAARYGIDDIATPAGWVILSFILDQRTGLDRFREFRIGHEQLIIELIDRCRTQRIDEILEVPDVRERLAAYWECDRNFVKQILAKTEKINRIGVIDLRSTETVYPGNRYRIYALFPDITLSIQVLKGSEPNTVSLAVGKSIFNKTTKIHVGNLMATFGGGGHANAGACQVARDAGEETLKELILAIARDGG
jgi:hypothetical protein